MNEELVHYRLSQIELKMEEHFKKEEEFQKEVLELKISTLKNTWFRNIFVAVAASIATIFGEYLIRR